MKRKDWLWLGLAGLLFQGLWLLLLPEPAYMDAYYYTSNGQRLAEGHGWTELVIWQYLDDPAGVPTPSHTYWMPLPSLLAAAGYTLTSSFRGAQLPFWLLASLLPLLSYLISYKLGGERWQNVAAALLTMSGGFYAANWAQPETFAPFAWAGAGCLYLLAGQQVSRSAGQPVGPQHSVLSTQYSVLRYVFVGVLAALAHLTRADGLLLLIIAIIIIIIPPRPTPHAPRKEGETTGKLSPGDPPSVTPVAPPLHNSKLQTRNSKLIATRLLATLLGYILTMLPWFLHNLDTTGTILPTVGTQTMFLTNYDDLFAYGRTFDLSSYLEWGIGNIIRSKVAGLWVAVQTFIAVNGLIFLTPFILIGGWVRWREGKQAWLRPLILYTLFLFAAMSLVFTFPGERGGLLHSSVALWPWFMALVPVGIGWSVDGLARRLPHWQPERAKRLFTGLFIGVALVMSLVVGLARGSADIVAMLYPEVGTLLPDDAVVMVGNAPGFYYHTGLSAYSIPNEPLETVLAAAARYHITHLILDENRPLPLADLYQGMVTPPTLELVTTLETIQIYRLVPAKND